MSKQYDANGTDIDAYPNDAYKGGVYDAWREKITMSNKPENVKCPDCDGEMTPRTSQHGKFWGCKSYPRCKGTRDSNGLSRAEREQEKRLKDPQYDGNDLVDEENLSNGEKTSFNKK